MDALAPEEFGTAGHRGRWLEEEMSLSWGLEFLSLILLGEASARRKRGVNLCSLRGAVLFQTYLNAAILSDDPHVFSELAILFLFSHQNK